MFMLYFRSSFQIPVCNSPLVIISGLILLVTCQYKQAYSSNTHFKPVDEGNLRNADIHQQNYTQKIKILTITAIIEYVPCSFITYLKSLKFTAKVKAHQAMKTYVGSGGIAIQFLTSALNTSCFTPRDRRLCGAHGQCGRSGKEKYFAPTGNRTPAIQPAAIRLTMQTPKLIHKHISVRDNLKQMI